MENKCSKCVDGLFRKQFCRLGRAVGRSPGYFVVVPLLLTALCSTGFQRLSYNSDPEYLFSPLGGQAKADRALLEEHFPTNYSDFQASRISRAGKMARLVVAAKDGRTLLRENIWDELLVLNEEILNITVQYEGVRYNYTDLCAKFNSDCYTNSILAMSKAMPDIMSGQLRITYPIYFDLTTYETFFLPAVFGGISVDEEGLVDGVEAISLAYFLDVSEEWREVLGDQWEKRLIDRVQWLADNYIHDLEITQFVSNTPSWEMERSKLSVTPILCFNVLLMVVFCFCAAFTNDAVRSKPLLSLMGLLSAAFGMLAGFGFCMYVNIDFISLNFAAPFLLLGIGVDDGFVVLSCWHRTPSTLPYGERLAMAYSEAAVSITVTSLTNLFGFLTGVCTPFPCVQIFCLYSGISIIFIYTWHITLFGGCLALAGRAEENNKHCLVPCVTVVPKSLSQNRSWFYRTFMSGGINRADPDNLMDNQEFGAMTFFRDRLGGALSKGWVKVLVLVCFAVYLGVAIFGVVNIQEGMDKRNIANFDSYAAKYYDMEDKYFKEFSYTISVIISGPNLDFSNKQTQAQIKRVIKELESSQYIEPAYSQNWLEDFLQYVERNRMFSDVQLPISTESDFAKTLNQKYFQDGTVPQKLDVAFSADKSRVEAARFLIQGRNITDSLLEQNMVAELRGICARMSTDQMNVTVFHPFFIFIDQYLAIFSQAMQTIFITALVMVIISLTFIPSFTCTIWVTFSIVSIEIGVLGFMTLWDIRLDGVALINLVMCIGFSVDFSAHICYHFITHRTESGGSEPIRTSLYALGWPIVQGATSTIIGVFGLAFAPSYIFITFFKMILLVIVLGALHGLILLPVLLTLFENGNLCGRRSSKPSLLLPFAKHPFSGGNGDHHFDLSCKDDHPNLVSPCASNGNGSVLIDGRRVLTYPMMAMEVNKAFVNERPDGELHSDFGAVGAKSGMVALQPQADQITSDPEAMGSTQSLVLARKFLKNQKAPLKKSKRLDGGQGVPPKRTREGPSLGIRTICESDFTNCLEEPGPSASSPSLTVAEIEHLPVVEGVSLHPSVNRKNEEAAYLALLNSNEQLHRTSKGQRGHISKQNNRQQRFGGEFGHSHRLLARTNKGHHALLAEGKTSHQDSQVVQIGGASPAMIRVKKVLDDAENQRSDSKPRGVVNELPSICEGGSGSKIKKYLQKTNSDILGVKKDMQELKASMLLHPSRAVAEEGGTGAKKKQPLRKANTFPYQALLNSDSTSHSSDTEDSFIGQFSAFCSNGRTPESTRKR